MTTAPGDPALHGLAPIWLESITGLPADAWLTTPAVLRRGRTAGR